MKMYQFRVVAASTAVLLAAGFLASPEAAAQRKKGAAIGAGLGALLGQAIGKDTESTLIGAGVGTGVGYIIGNERDKAKADSMNNTTKSAPAETTTTAAAEPAETAEVTTITSTSSLSEREDVGLLKDTKWKLVSLNPATALPEYMSKVFIFRPDGILETITTTSDGNVHLSDETYRVVDDVLILNRPGYLVNARYLLDGDQLILNAQEFSAVFERLTPEIE